MAISNQIIFKSVSLWYQTEYTVSLTSWLSPPKPVILWCQLTQWKYDEGEIRIEKDNTLFLAIKVQF